MTTTDETTQMPTNERIAVLADLIVNYSHVLPFASMVEVIRVTIDLINSEENAAMGPYTKLKHMNSISYSLDSSDETMYIKEYIEAAKGKITEGIEYRWIEFCHIADSYLEEYDCLEVAMFEDSFLNTYEDFDRKLLQYWVEQYPNVKAGTVNEHHIIHNEIPY